MVKVVLSTGVIFLAILAIRKLFRGKAGNVFLYAIWLLFAAGLVVPILSFALREMAGWEKSRVKSPVSIMNFVEMPSETANKASGAVQKEKEGREGDREKKQKGEEKEEKNTEKYSKSAQEEGKNGRGSWLRRIQLKQVFLFIWAAGAAAILFCQVLMEKAFRRQLIENREETDYQGQKIYRAKGIKTPLLFRSKGVSADIYLPEAIMGN